MNIKSTLYILFLYVMMLAVLSCGGGRDHGHEHDGHEHHGESDAGEWQQMDEFHMVMAETFHPYKDSANLEPARTRASELLAAADEWMEAPLPEKVNNQQVRDKLVQLRSDAAALVESVQAQNDEHIANNLTKLHDTFHAIMEEWYQ